MSVKTCNTCGTAYRPDATPNGLCPTCLIARGVESDAGRPPATGATPGRAAPPSVEELAEHFPQLELLEIQGRGGMGAVYRARQRELGRTVALKILPADVGNDPDFAERFRREARALAALSHTGIVHLYEFGQSGGWWWFVMEFVDGATLRGLLADGPVEPSLALSIVRQVCDALDYAHSQGVVHRDIKPENILVDRAGRVKIVDFGLARLVGGDARDLTLTYTGQRMGTPHYMAPEQWEDPSGVDHRADIYALGVVFYELLTRELPVGRFGPPSDKSDVAGDIDRIVMKALERDRDRRYQHTADMGTDVSSSSPMAEAPHDAHDGKRKKRKKAKVSKDAVIFLPEARGGAAWFTKAFAMVGGGMVLAAIAAVFTLFVALDAEYSLALPQRALGEGRPVANVAEVAEAVSGATAASLTALSVFVTGALVLFLARRRAHRLDREAAAPLEGVPRPWMKRRGVLAVMGVTGFLVVSFAAEQSLGHAPLAGLFEFGVLVLALQGIGLATRVLWRILPKRVPRAVPLTLASALSVGIVLAMFAEREHEIRDQVAMEAMAGGGSGAANWSASPVQPKVLNSLSRQNLSLDTPLGGWISASFTPRAQISRTEPGRVSWDVRVDEPDYVADDVGLVFTASVSPVDGMRLAGDHVHVLPLGSGAQTHYETVSFDMSELAEMHPNERYVEWEPSLLVQLCRLSKHGTANRLGQVGSGVRGTYWTYRDKPFTTAITDEYPADFPRLVEIDSGFEPKGWRVLSRALIQDTKTPSENVERWAFDAMMRFDGMLDVPVPFAAQYDISPTDEWIEADKEAHAVSLDYVFGSGAMVIVPNEATVVARASDAILPAPLASASASSSTTVLTREWSERHAPISFERSNIGWRGRFADDVFNRRVDSVRIMVSPSRDAALDAPYDIDEMWTGEPLEFIVPLIQ